MKALPAARFVRRSREHCLCYLWGGSAGAGSDILCDQWKASVESGS